MTTRESAVADAFEAVLTAHILVWHPQAARHLCACGHDVPRGSVQWHRAHLAAVLAALDTTPQPALSDEEKRRLRGLGQGQVVPAVEAILAARAHQPTPPAQAEAVAALDSLPIAQRDEMVAQVWQFLLARGYTISLDPLTTARAIADTAAAEAGSADTAARVRRTGGD